MKIDVNDIKDYANKLKKMEEKIDVNRESTEIQEYKISKNNNKIRIHLESCDKIHKYITPVISKKGLQHHYKQLFEGFRLDRYLSEQNLVIFSSFKDSVNAKTIDVKNTVQLNALLFQSKFAESANKLKFTNYIMEQGWIVYNTDDLLKIIVTALN